jgi:hypothetical protein
MPNNSPVRPTTKAGFDRTDFRVLAPNMRKVTLHYYLGILSQEVSGIQSWSNLRENDHFVFWGPCEGPLFFGGLCFWTWSVHIRRTPTYDG